MKTAEEVLKETTRKTLNIVEASPLHDAVISAMKIYANQKLDEAAEKHQDTYISLSDYRNAVKAILSLKDKIQCK